MEKIAQNPVEMCDKNAENFRSLRFGRPKTNRSHLGYCQTVWEDFESDTEIWSDYAKRTSPQTIYRLVEQINTLLKCSTEAINHCISDAVGPSGGLYFDNPKNARVWLNRFQTYLLSMLSQK